MAALPYISAYPPKLQQQAQQLLDEGRLGALLLSRYGQAQHSVRTDGALYDYVQDLKADHLRQASPEGSRGLGAYARALDWLLGTDHAMELAA